ncbi:ABC transporter ATP-binding protein [Dawidia soli]|uniref:AAA family ATPase n=1 Tax=Dawidia soli TaxID=2782352 RepID=A0AAP2DD98_9BACT|nr:ATP-binding cassette domain-containing protein [Dawidia soli]MBT1689559.1 AAA family ATPase [Dawidia soli]
MIQFDRFAKRYGTTTIVQIDALTLPVGIYWVKGANGSGKSTLLRSMAGVLHFRGDIAWNDLRLKKDTVSYRRVVNFAEAEPLFPEFLTGMEMIDLFRTAKSGARRQEEHYIESMHMQSYIHQPIGTYSSGMLKKLSLVLAFLGTPQLILLDEPAITLDAEALEALDRWIIGQYTRQGTTFLISSHQPLAMESLPLRHLLVAHHTVTVTA